jgi:hypothetical protein
MQRFSLTALLVLVALGSTAVPVPARGPVATDEPWGDQHVGALPAEIRGALQRMCGPSVRAQHYFALYSQDSRLITLHFEQLHCGSRGALCKTAGCLHQVYERSGGRYRLQKSFYAPGND